MRCLLYWSVLCCLFLFLLIMCFVMCHRLTAVWCRHLDCCWTKDRTLCLCHDVRFLRNLCMEGVCVSRLFLSGYRCCTRNNVALFLGSDVWCDLFYRMCNILMVSVSVLLMFDCVRLHVMLKCDRAVCSSAWPVWLCRCIPSISTSSMMLL